MTRTILSPRAASGGGGAERLLAHPFAFAIAALLLLLAFSWTFVVHPGRVAPGDDPAFYTWRTEALLSEEPATVLQTAGPQDVLAGGYRVTTPVLGGILRRTLGIAPETTTVILTVGIRVLIALLLAGFAFRHDRDPLVFHGVAFGTASLLLSPPFFGYLDNLLCLLFLTASLFFLGRVRVSWSARAIFFGLLFLAGMTHPTTLVFFCLVLGAMTLLRWFARRLDLKSVLRQDASRLGSAFVAVLAVVAAWRLGAWGPAASLTEAAVPPPADETFFFTRLVDWVSAMDPLLNAPLFAIGVVTVVAGGRRALGDDDLRLVSVAWLLPLAGIFGFVAGFAYPYYRFFNTTLAWVLLIGIGGAALARFFVTRARSAGPLALVGILGIVAIFVANFASDYPRWDAADEAWLTSAQEAEFAAVRSALEEHGGDRPVVFVVDSTAEDRVRVYGFMKFSANVSRHGLPHGYLDRGYVYLGDVDRLLAGEATSGSNAAYREISEATLEDARAAGSQPVVVVAESFNRSGANAGLFDDRPPVPPPGVWVVADGRVTAGGEELALQTGRDAASVARVLWTGAGLLLLCAVGALAVRALPDAGVAAALGLVPALTIAFLTFAGFIVLAVVRVPLSTSVAWASVAAAAAGAFFLQVPRASR
ncbi:MAG TPA: hypothetical protein VM784_00455 [Actinomycetota bacterium]|nr:hypothetical protein [Actinomycetota bacterium]